MLIETVEVDRKFPTAAGIAVSLWIVLVTTIRCVTPEEDFVVLEGVERQAPLLAAVILVTSLLFFLLPFLKVFQTTRQQGKGSVSNRRPSGILVAAVCIVLVAISTNLMLACFPTPVMKDPVTGARVFLMRWCEWTPLAGLMTFLSDVVDAPKRRGIAFSALNGLTQLVSASCGLVFPFCTGLFSWSVVQVISMATYLPIFPRVEQKRKQLARASDKHMFGLQDKESCDRRFFAYHLLKLCSMVWTILVVVYYVHVLIYLYLPEGHWLQHQSSAMVVDTAFDVLAKSLYLTVILQVHNKVFASQVLSHRQLEELRRLMQVLWDSTTDTMVISVRNEERTFTFLSPSFHNFVGGQAPSSSGKAGRPGYLVQTSSTGGGNLKESPIKINEAMYIDSSHISSSETMEKLTIAPIDVNLDEMRMATEFIQTCWNHLGGSDSPVSSGSSSEEDNMLLFQFDKSDKETIHCEVKVSPAHKQDDPSTSISFVAILRDVTERSKRREAERKARAEVLARQKDAQKANRFTRHEVKNGLLAGIELCDGLHRLVRKADNDNKREDTAPKANVGDPLNSKLTGDPLNSKLTGTVCQIDRVLHEILETVLAEAMARDVIHETYQVNPKRTDLVDMLQSFLCGAEQRFPCIVPQKDDLPDLLLDAQLFRYIHRNAISNASKYGKPGGTISTRVHYDHDSERLEVEVVNEPGPGHESLLEIGQEASEGVFQPGKRLHNHTNHHFDSSLSSGDGGYIMQKCARNLGGECTISFEPEQTVFRFHCHASPVVSEDSSQDSPKQEFQLPPDTFAIGIDDSWIQRKLLVRLFSNFGIQPKRGKVLGRNLAELNLTGTLITQCLSQDPDAKILVLVDENLDFDCEGARVVRSGSRMMQAIMSGLHPRKRDRILVLVRSANDSAEDAKLYCQRTHGFFPKTKTRREDILELLEPCWMSRFGKNTNTTSPLSVLGLEFDDDSDSFSKDDLKDVVLSVDSLISSKPSFRDVPWSHLWSSLHSLKGDLAISDNSHFQQATTAINEMRGGCEAPDDFQERWAVIRATIMEGIDDMEQ